MQTLYINLFGGPGCGKSVAMAALFVALKKAGYSCEMVTEYAKDLVWENRMGELDNQHQVARMQYRLLKSRQGHTSFVVTDGPLGNALYYNRNYPHVCDVEKTEQAVLGWLGEFQALNLFLTRGDFQYEREGRYQTEAQARSMDAPILDALTAHLPVNVLAACPDAESLAKEILRVAATPEKFDVSRVAGQHRLPAEPRAVVALAVA